MARRVRARAYASIANLGYGFDVFAVCVDAAYDEIELEEGSKGLTLQVEGEGAGTIPTDPKRNTAGLALLALLRDRNIRTPLHLRITKGIRPGSGLGSSAASAAAAVAAANEFFRLDLSLEQLTHYAAQGEAAAAGAPHKDNVSAALYGGFTICDSQRILRLNVPKGLCFVIALPEIHVSTRDSRRVLPRRIALSEYSRGAGRCGLIAAAIATGDISMLGRAVEGSFIERSRSKLIPGYDAVCAAARKAGAVGATISGSGPSIVALTDQKGNTAAIRQAMSKAFRRNGIRATTYIAGPARGVEVMEVR